MRVAGRPLPDGGLGETSLPRNGHRGGMPRNRSHRPLEPFPLISFWRGAFGERRELFPECGAFAFRS
jgi:hypothetical protein